MVKCYTDDMIGMLQGEIDSMKCCGNCNKWQEAKYHDCPYTIDDAIKYGPNTICDRWEYDGLTAEDRKI
jgi:hypothetical protein